MKFQAPLPAHVEGALRHVESDLTRALRHDGLAHCKDLDEDDPEREEALDMIEAARNRVTDLILASDAAALRQTKEKP